MGKPEEARAVEELVVKLEEVAEAAQEVKETRQVLDSEKVALEAVDEALLAAQEATSLLEATGLVEDAKVVHEMEGLLASGDADGEVMDMAVNDAAELAKALQERGQGAVAKEVGQLEAKLRAASNAGKGAENQQKQHAAKAEARAVVSEMKDVASGLEQAGDEELARDVLVLAEKIHNDPEEGEMEEAAVAGKKAVAKLQAMGKPEEARAVEELVV